MITSNIVVQRGVVLLSLVSTAFLCFVLLSFVSWLYYLLKNKYFNDTKKNGMEIIQIIRQNCVGK